MAKRGRGPDKKVVGKDMNDDPGDTEKENLGILDRPVPGLIIFLLILISAYVLVLAFGTWAGRQILVGMEFLFMMPFLYFFQAFPRFISVILEYLLYGITGFVVLALVYLIPYFLIISLLEDIGYMNKVNRMFLRLSSETGYPSLTVVPYALGLGCTISALHSLSYAPDKRFRILTAPFLIAAPCSAKVVIVVGLVLRYAGILPALLILLIDILIVGLGLVLLARFVKPVDYDYNTEARRLKRPSPKGIWRWTKWHLRSYLRFGLPLIAGGSVAVGLLRHIGLLRWLGETLDPAAGLLFGISGIALVFLFVGVLRKELGIELFALVGGFTLSAIMSPSQMFTFALMSTLFVPCLGVVVMLFKMYGPKHAGAMLGASLGLAFGVGILAHIGVWAVGW